MDEQSEEMGMIQRLAMGLKKGQKDLLSEFSSQTMFKIIKNPEGKISIEAQSNDPGKLIMEFYAFDKKAKRALAMLEKTEKTKKQEEAKNGSHTTT